MSVHPGLCPKKLKEINKQIKAVNRTLISVILDSQFTSSFGKLNLD